MLTTLMIGQDNNACAMIRGTIEQYCNDIVFKGMVPEPDAAYAEPHARPDMIFWDLQTGHPRPASPPTVASDVLNVFLIQDPDALHSIANTFGLQSVHSLLHKPLHVPELLIALGNARSIVELRRNLQSQRDNISQLIERQSHPGTIGIPTDDGIEFVMAQDILRCEGLNKYTLIVTTCQGNLVSSYNIGEFARLLQPHGFFAAHKSHLVNLRRVRRLTNENMLILQDGAQVPLSRRRRLEFLHRYR